METLKFLLILLAAFVVIVHADLPHFDEYWNVRAVEAKENTIEAYHPDPFNVTNKFNYLVNQATIDLNGTRRSLFRKNRKKGGGPCVATNPIDQCWRCNPRWAENRKRLAECALGFGYKTTGGKNGKFYVVTDPSDNDMVNPKPGTLRYAVIQKVPLWITFSRNMNIRLNQELIMTGDKTIDARGAQVHITGGAGLTLQFIKNVIIHGLYIHDIVVGSGGMIRDSVDHYGFRTQSDGDGISIFGSTNVWIDHVSMSKCQDGLIDAIMGSTAVTVSNCHFTDHNEVMLFGASDGYTGDTLMQITVAFNHFGKGLVQRMPRCRYGFVHVVNNDYTHWRMYAIGGSRNPTIISQGNRFIAPNDLNCKQVTKREYAMESEWKNWNWRSQEDLLMNGAYFVQSGNSKINRKFTTQQIIKSKPGSFVSKLTRSSGPLGCCVGRAC